MKEATTYLQEENRNMKILLIGPQGSGKSTQGKLLSEYLNVPFIVTGDILREIAESDTDEGKRLKGILESGNLVDDETVIALIKNRLQKEDCESGFILDGYPRTDTQAEKIDEVGFQRAVYINASQSEVTQRLLKRGRIDDTEELIKKRLELYFNQTQPLLDFYRSKGILVEIDGMGDVEKIQNEIREKIK